MANCYSIFLGAICSGVAGFIGMYSATKANVRTAVAAKEKGASDALNVAFFGGSIMGLQSLQWDCLVLEYYFIILQVILKQYMLLKVLRWEHHLLPCFSRVGGGIFTKSADVGADLVGKVEAGIPEDDPRNPGVIADNVGDNVGDVAGMGSDIFESYCGSMIACIALAASMTNATINSLGGNQYLLQFMPLALASLGIVCSIIGILTVKVILFKKCRNSSQIWNDRFSSCFCYIIILFS